jgi:hypothetical protein
MIKEIARPVVAGLALLAMIALVIEITSSIECIPSE